MKARVIVRLKNGILDPQGKAIEGALHGFGPRRGRERFGKEKSSTSNSTPATAPRPRHCFKQACDKLLANTIVENYHIEIL